MTATFASVRVVPVLGAWASFLATYLMFAGEASADEIVAGGVCAAGAVAWWLGTRRASDHSFAFELSDWAAAGRACRKLPRATLCVAAVLLRGGVRGEEDDVERWPYAHSRARDSAAGGRRAIGVLAASLAPDSFVLRTPVDRDEVVVHSFVRREPSTDPRWPI